jgi:hypothetical protein
VVHDNLKKKKEEEEEEEEEEEVRKLDWENDQTMEKRSKRQRDTRAHAHLTQPRVL